jgi:cation:H+ antiporter
MIVELAALSLGIVLLAYCSERGVDHAVHIAETFGIPTIIVGILVVSVGTDLPEIANSILASLVGHGDINVGDSLGSCLTQISLVLGLVGILSETIVVDKEEILELGRSELMGLLLAIFVSKTGYISREDAALLLFGYILLVVALRHYLLKNHQAPEKKVGPRSYTHVAMLFIFMAGIALGSYLVVTSVISLSKDLSIPEYMISFFVVAIGTSLPELVVDITAARRKEYALAIGDIIGSNIVDSTLSIGIGPLISPVYLSGGLVSITGLWTLIVSLIVIATLWLMGRLNRRIGIVFVVLYLLSYAILLMA